MTNCIVVNKIQFTHQTIYNGPDDGVHCHFCGRHWVSKQAADAENTVEEYPGQAFYHANNEAVRRAELNWGKKNKR